MSMRTILFAAVATVALALGGCADEQMTGSSPPAATGQGGYLGSNPGANAPTAATNAPAAPGSGQGGYLGSNVGAGAGAPTRMTEADMMKNPAMWCRMSAMDMGRCSGRSSADHAYCMEKAGGDPVAYQRCRRTMDFIGWHN